MDPSRKTVVFFFTLSLYFFFILSPTIALKPKAKHTPPSAAPAQAIPYETVNKFCLYRRLDVDRPFCLSVLKSRHAALAKHNDLVPLLEVAINSTSIFMCKTLSFLQEIYDKNKTKTVEGCLSAYEEIAGYMTKVITDISQEPSIAGVDGEVITNYINRCDKAVAKLAQHKGSEISDKNQEATKYAKLMMDIADSLSNNNHS